jgi:hypothetical protein
LHLDLQLLIGIVQCRRVKLTAARISMKAYWLKLLLLTTFAFWASGVAKYAHELMEHHGRDASVDDDDDDDDSAAVTSVAVSPLQKNPTQTATQTPVKKKCPCPVCQMLAAMVLDRTAPIVWPDCSNQLLGTLILLDWIAPDLLCCFASSARDPPAGALAL